VIAERELVSVRCLRYKNGSMVLHVPFKGVGAVPQLPQPNLYIPVIGTQARGMGEGRGEVLSHL
jgi:hypothetical protein